MTRILTVGPGKAGFLTCLSLFGAICYLAARYDTFPGDAGALRRFQELRSPALDDIAVFASALANLPVAVASVLGLAVILWAFRKKADALAALLVLIAGGINLGVKELVDRPRPDYSLLVDPPTNGVFPSGHAIHVFVLLGLIIIIVGESIKSPTLRLAIQGPLAFMIMICGASRVYLGVHWPSDVIGGFLLGGISLVGILWLRKTLFSRGL